VLRTPGKATEATVIMRQALASSSRRWTRMAGM